MISVYDIEVYPNLFCSTFLDIKTKEVVSFVVSPWQDQWKEFLQHYRSHEGLIGFNNVDYDERVLHPFIDELPENFLKALYKRSGKVISDDFDEKRVIPHVPQRDLYRIHHYNNKARMTSLKYLQINMGWRNVMESPFPFDKPVREADVALILDYNVNDVKSTYEFYLRTRGKIKLRNKLGEKYKVNMGNFNDGKIGEAIFLKEISAKTGRSERDIRSRNTPRKNIIIRDVLIPGIEFKSKEFGTIFNDYLGMSLKSTRKKNQKALYTVFDGVQYEFGFGGIHACRNAGAYHKIDSVDVSSYYPNLAIQYKIYPQHLGPVYCIVYDLIFQERKQYKKGTDESEALKLALNVPFGQSNAPWSIFYDPLYTMAITVNGQLLLAMLCEEITLEGAGSIIMANTDGIEVIVSDQVKFETICQRWQEKTKLVLESSRYEKLFVRDVNNYIGFKKEGYKAKGAYEIEREIHKNQSMKIVRQSVIDYFEKGVPVENTINSCKTIDLFLLAKRAKTGSLEYREAGSGELKVTKLPKNVRYYISRSGGSLVKITKATEKQKKKEVAENQLGMFGDIGGAKVADQMRITDLHSGYRETLFNNWIDKSFEDYNIETQFYVREANKLINAVINSQTKI